MWGSYFPILPETDGIFASITPPPKNICRYIMNTLSMPSDTFSSINSIIERDKTDTPYKYSLLQSVIECCQEYPQYASLNQQTRRIHIPTGLCVAKWLIYYYPFFLPGTFIAMKKGERNGNRQITFRPLFQEVCQYYEKHGGLSVFYDELVSGNVSGEIRDTLAKLISQIRYTITDNPMRHLGYSQTGKEYSVFSLEKKPAAIKKSDTLSLQLLIERCGSFSISSELYSVFRELGGFIIGSGCIAQKWMEFLQRQNTDSGITDGELMERFSMYPVSERNVSDAAKLFHEHSRTGACSCVWSGQRLNESTLAIDHLLPFAVWRCNDLWNLIPSDTKVNLRKSDSIPNPLFLRERKNEILECWDLLYALYPERFEREITVGLLGGVFMDNWKERAFERLCETARYLTEVRGYADWRN